MNFKYTFNKCINESRNLIKTSVFGNKVKMKRIEQKFADVIPNCFKTEETLDIVVGTFSF